MVAVAARPGGAGTAAADEAGGAEAMGVAELIAEIKSRIQLPERRCVLLLTSFF